MPVLLLVLIVIAFCCAASQAAPPVPRPDFARDQWASLDGGWEFAFDPQDVGEQEGWEGVAGPAYPLRINVPFGWESELSGVHRPDYQGVAWYRRRVTLPPAWQGQRVWLCCGAVDWAAKVWVNGRPVGEHEGGYSEFRLDITDAARFDRPNVVVVRAEDHTDPATPIGKQIHRWYTSTSGIWQSVWVEATGPACVQSVRLTPVAGKDGAPTGEVRAEVAVDRAGVSRALPVEIRSTNRQFPAAKGTLAAGRSTLTLTLRVTNPKLWTPDTPTLYPLVVVLGDAAQPLDRVQSYFGLRTVAWGPWGGSEFSYVLLNGKPLYLCGALDQSFNPRGVYTAPDDEFLQRDLQLAKAAGLNMLRIHIKADQPRRLYWADKLGLLIQADIPCAFEISDRARHTFEQTMRDQMARDHNHPAIYCWTVFNEEWGIGRLGSAPESHRVGWVEQMQALARRLDPSRLVQDNTGWSHLVTDLNSFHWYSRDVDAFRRQYREVNDKEIYAGSPWNYIAGRQSRGEPFVNNEFGYIGAGDGDSDMSWGNLFATNAMRACERLVGYTYTELTDIEWEHNGIYNYDRSPKEFGFDFWLPGMTVADVFARDFLVLDVPAVKYARLGDVVQVPALFSHYSGQHAKGLTLRWQVRWLDSLGRWHEGPVQSQACPPTPPYRLTWLAGITVELPREHALVTLAAWLEGTPTAGDISGSPAPARGTLVSSQRPPLARNYTQWLVGKPDWLPRAELLDERTVALRWRPEDWAVSAFDELREPTAGKYWGLGTGKVEYRLRLPAELPVAELASIEVVCEAAAKAGREKVDWPSRVRPEDYPQTDGKKWPTTVNVLLGGRLAATWQLADDPADARGPLSHWKGLHYGSYGYRSTARSADSSLFAELAAGKPLTITFEVPASQPGGFALYGQEMGCYPMEPTVLLHFRHPLPLPAGWQAEQAVAVDRYWAALEPLLPAATRGGARWRYTTTEPPATWLQPGFNDQGWAEGPGGFGSRGTPGAVIGTPWQTADIWLRTTVDLPALAAGDVLSLEVHHDEDVEVYVNGQLLWMEGGYLGQYKTVPLSPARRALFTTGRNTLAVHCHQTTGGQYVDVGVVVRRAGRATPPAR